MANANPAGLGYAVPQGGVRPELNIPKGSYIVRTAKGDIVKRRVMSNGNVVNTSVFADEFKNVALSEAEYEAAVNPTSETEIEDSPPSQPEVETEDKPKAKAPAKKGK